MGPAARELRAELEALVSVGEARRAAADSFLIGLRPAASDWMTTSEVDRLCDLQAALVPFAWDEREAARARVAAKRAARVAARAAVTA